MTLFAQLLNRAPACQGLTQGEIADRLAARGEKVAQTTVSAWHRGAAIPRSTKRLEVIAQVYGLPRDVVMRAAFAPRPKLQPHLQAAGRLNRRKGTGQDELREDIARLEGQLAEILSLLRAGGTAPGGAPTSAEPGGGARRAAGGSPPGGRRAR